MSLVTTIELKLISALTGTALDLGSSPRSDVNYTKLVALASGVGLNQADMIWHDQRTLTTAANEDLDLGAGGVTDALGDTLALAKLKMLLFFSASANTTLLTVSRPAGTAGVPFLATASNALVLHPGGLFLLTNPSLAGYAVGASDLINVANAAGASATFDVFAIGTTA